MTTSVAVFIAEDITAGMFGAGTTVAAVDATQGEVAWVSGGTYAQGDLRVYGDSIYGCPLAHTGRTALPSVDSAYWKRKGPSNRYAPFDYYISTQAVSTGAVTFVLTPGFFTDVRLDGLTGDHVEITVRDGPGGPVLKTLDQELWEQAIGFYELMFLPLARRTTASLEDIDLNPNAELTVTVSSAPSAPVGIGGLRAGTWLSLIGTSAKGGTEYGGQAVPKSYSYVNYNSDGTYEYVQRRSAIDLRFDVLLDADQANTATDILLLIQDKPVPIRASNLPNYRFLSTVGVVTGTVSPLNFVQARVSINVKGFI